MKVALYINDAGGVDAGGSNFHDIDLSNPQLGSPGIGGTHYEFVMLAYALANFSNVEVNFYHYNKNKLPSGVQDWIIHDTKELHELVKRHGNDIFILWGIAVRELNNLLSDNDIKCILWLHNYHSYLDMKYFYSISSIKRIVLVSHEHYDYYLDHSAIKKCTYICNMFDGRNLKLRDFPSKPAVTYTGGLYKGKSFHILASMWKDILREVPEAKLYVVGSGKLYNHDSKLGPFGVADSEYEAMFADYLMQDGKLLPSVKFCGSMGLEKTDIYYKTTVGITNFYHETFCISALEMEACGVPVVNISHGGVLDTIIHNETGLLAKNYDEIKKYIIMLLKDKELNLRIGRQAREFASSAFLPEKIVKQWLKLFDEVMNDRPAEYIKPSGNYMNNYKWLKIINRWLRLHHLSTASLSEMANIMFKFFRHITKH